MRSASADMVIAGRGGREGHGGGKGRGGPDLKIQGCVEEGQDQSVPAENPSMARWSHSHRHAGTASLVNKPIFRKREPAVARQNLFSCRGNLRIQIVNLFVHYMFTIF